MSNNESKNDQPVKKLLPPWLLIEDIKKNYNEAQQRRILELLQKALATPNPYDKNSLRG